MLIDRRLVEAYFILRFAMEIGHGQSAASRPEEPGFGARRCPQSASGGGARCPVCRQPLLRPERPRPGALRDGTAPQRRRYSHQRRRRHLRRVAADLLQGSGHDRRGRACRLAAAAARPQRRAQDLCGGCRLRCQSQSRHPRADHAAMSRRRRNELRHQGPSPQPGTRAGTQKKALGPP